MTTPEDGSHAGEPAKAKGAATPRVRRPELARSGPNRSETSAPAPPPPSPPPNAPPMASVKDADEESISDTVAQAVRMGYSVLAQNIQQGREAAKRFGQGEYKASEVPGDLEVAGKRLLQVARILSTAAYEVCETLLKELGTAVGTPDRTATATAPTTTAAPTATPSTPPFRPVVTPVISAPPPPPSPPSPPPGVINLKVALLGAAKATSATQALKTPEQPTLAADIFVTPLASPDIKAPPIVGIVFQTDGPTGGLVAAVPIPDGQPGGVYSGIVFAKGQGMPLGMLTVEITA